MSTDTHGKLKVVNLTSDSDDKGTENGLVPFQSDGVPPSFVNKPVTGGPSHHSVHQRESFERERWEREDRSVN